MKGNWTRAWPNQNISLLDCVFKNDESVSKGFFNVSTHVEAENKEAAKLQGREKIERACYAFELIMGGSIMLKRDEIELKAEGERYYTTEKSIGTCTAIFNPNPPSPKELRRLKNCQRKLKLNNVLRVIHWLGEGKQETDPIDRFIKFWIAFETLGKNCAPAWAKNCWFAWMKNAWMKNCFNDADKKELDELRGYRGKLLHEGLVTTSEQQQKAEKMQRHLERCLKNYLGLKKKNP